MTYGIGLGGNLGDPVRAMRTALALLDRRGAVVEAVSGVYRTSPQERTDQPDFLNAACTVAFAFEPPILLAILKEIEYELGRRSHVRYGPRPIDLDILVWSGGTWESADLTVPHPKLHLRRFAAEPLLAIDPGLVLPDGTTLHSVVEALRRDETQTLIALPDIALR